MKNPQRTAVVTSAVALALLTSAPLATSVASEASGPERDLAYAQAAAGVLEPGTVSKEVIEPAGPIPEEMESYLATLPANEAADVRRTSVPVTITKEVVTTPVASVPSIDARSSSTKQCYMSSASFNSKNAVGVVLIRWNLTHAWCTSNNRVVEAGPTNGGITFAGYGWKDLNQETFQGAVTNYGWRGRSLGKYKASWAPSGVHLWSSTNCARLVNNTHNEITFRGTGCTL